MPALLLFTQLIPIYTPVQVSLVPAPTVSFQPHPEHDAQELASLTHLANRIDSHGYYGGVRLLMVRQPCRGPQQYLGTYTVSQRCSLTAGRSGQPTCCCGGVQHDSHTAAGVAATQQLH